MRLFVQLQNGSPIAWGLTPSQVRSRAPVNTSFPANDAQYETVNLTEFGFQTFVPVQHPAFDAITQSAAELAPVLVSGAWTQQWQLVALDAPTAAANLKACKDGQIALLFTAYQAAIALPVTYAGKLYQADPISISNLGNSLSGCQAAQATPAGFYWVAADNSQVPFSYVDLKGLAAAFFAQGSAAFQKLQTLKSQVAAAGTGAAVSAVVWQ